MSGETAALSTNRRFWPASNSTWYGRVSVSPKKRSFSVGAAFHDVPEIMRGTASVTCWLDNAVVHTTTPSILVYQAVAMTFRTLHEASWVCFQCQKQTQHLKRSITLQLPPSMTPLEHCMRVVGRFRSPRRLWGCQTVVPTCSLRLISREVHVPGQCQCCVHQKRAGNICTTTGAGGA